MGRSERYFFVVLSQRIRVLVGAGLMWALCLGLAQPLQLELKGIRAKFMSTGSEIRIVWQDTSYALATFSLNTDKKLSLDIPVSVPGVPQAMNATQALGVQACGLTPTLAPANARIFNTEFILYGPDKNKPVAGVEFRGMTSDTVDLSFLVYADRDVDIIGTGTCSQETYGVLALKLNLKKGWNWVTFSTKQNPGKKSGELDVVTEAKITSKPKGSFELIPLKNER